MHQNESGSYVVAVVVVVGLASDLGPGRMLATIVSTLTLGVGYLMVAFREDKRSLHDLIVGTRVIYKR